MKRLSHQTHHADESSARSIVKALSYRAAILVLDFTAIYFFTGRVDTAVGFMIVSNIYTTVAYFVHERIWDRVRWGRRIFLRDDDAGNAALAAGHRGATP